MSMRFPLALLAGLLISGCGDSSTPAKPSSNSSGNPITAPVDYLGAVAAAKKSEDKNLDLVSINQAINQFEAAEGRKPKSLEELVETKYLVSIPKPPHGMKIVFDPIKSTVKIVPQ